jgi:hypothetical protein
MTRQYRSGQIVAIGGGAQGTDLLKSAIKLLKCGKKLTIPEKKVLRPLRPYYSPRNQNRSQLVLSNDETGELAALDGELILKKTIKSTLRAPPCRSCGFRNWVAGDTCFITQKNTREQQNGPIEMEWLCPGCALKRGLPRQHYRHNQYILPPAPPHVHMPPVPTTYRFVPATNQCAYHVAADDSEDPFESCYFFF